MALSTSLPMALSIHCSSNLRISQPSPLKSVLAVPFENSGRKLGAHSVAAVPFRSSCGQMRSHSDGIPRAHSKMGEGLVSSGSAYVPVYVMLPLGVLRMNSEVVEIGELERQLDMLKSINVDGVMVDCWWGIVESAGPLIYNWSGYKTLFDTVRRVGLKLQVVMSFHACGGNVGDDTNIPLPRWVLDVGHMNPDVFFTDKCGRRNDECLSLGVDGERVLEGRTAVEVYTDFMKAFRREFDDLFEDGSISEVEIGLGPCGELRYPSYPEKYGWRYPGIGEFQCYDKYMMRSLRERAVGIGMYEWAKAPEGTGSYNSKPYETEFFSDIMRKYNDYFGRFFLEWYSDMLLDHADKVLARAKHIFEGILVAAKVPGIHWWYDTKSHAAELTAGIFKTQDHDGYVPLLRPFAKNETIFNFTCIELGTENQDPAAKSDPEELVFKVINGAWDHRLKVAAENALPFYDRRAYDRVLRKGIPSGSGDRRHLCGFTYLRLCPTLLEEHNLREFGRFVARMHGLVL